MPMYNLSEYSENYYIISGSLWNFYGDKIKQMMMRMKIMMMVTEKITTRQQKQVHLLSIRQKESEPH